MDESPLFARAYDLVRESCVQSERMPRSRRAVLGRRMEDAAFLFHDSVSAAVRAKDPRPLLVEADSRRPTSATSTAGHACSNAATSGRRRLPRAARSHAR